MTRTTTNLRIITTIYYAEAALNILGGITILIIAGLIRNTPTNTEAISTLAKGLMIIGAIITIATAALYYFIAKGLKETKKWAYITAIILSTLRLIGGLINIAEVIGIVGIIINSYILYALLINKETKKLFQ